MAGAVLTTERENRSDLWISVSAGVVIAMQVVALAWVVSSTWFKQDDFVVLFRTTSAGGFPGSMLTVHGGHLVPGIVSVFWVLRSLFGMQWWAFVAVIAASQAVCSYLTWRVLKSFFRSRPISVLLLVIYSASVLTVSANMIAMSAIQYLPMQLAFPATLLLLQRYSRHPSFRTAVVTIAPVLIATLFFEKALTVVPFVVILCVITPLTKSSAATCRGRLRELRTPLAMLVAVTVAYAIFFPVFTGGSKGQAHFTFDAVAKFDLGPFLKNLVPSFFGGPGQFDSSGSISAPSDFEARASFIAFSALFVWSMIRCWKSIKYWALLLAMAGGNLVLIALANRTWVENMTRYMSDLVFPLVLLVGLAVLGNSNDENDGYSPIVRKVLQRSKALGLVLIVVAGIFVVAHSGNSQSAMVAGMKFAPGKSYAETARRTTETLDDAPMLLSQGVPPKVVSGAFWGTSNLNTTRVVLLPAGLNVRFGSVVENPFMVLNDGSVVPARFDRISRPISTGAGCLNVQEMTTTTLKLVSSPIIWGWYGRVRYTSTRESKVALMWSGPNTVIDLESGSHTIYFPITGGGNALTIGLDDSGVCLQEIEFLRLRADQ